MSTMLNHADSADIRTLGVNAKEIHSRRGDEMTVTLYADFSFFKPVISCRVETPEEDFVIYDIPHGRVLEVFNHPFSVGKSLLEKGRL